MSGQSLIKTINFNGVSLAMRVWDESGADTGPYAFESFVHPSSINSNVNAQPASVATAGAPVVGFDPYSQYAPFAASQSSHVVGASGAQYDYIDSILVIPATTSPGAVTIKDGNGSAITVFAGGSSSIATLHPFTISLGYYALAATTPGWFITTGLNVSILVKGKFT